MAKNATGTPARILFLGNEYAGHKTRFANLRASVEQDGRISAQFERITGWREGGTIERLPLLPGGVKGRLRATVEAAPYAALPRPDAVWTSAREELAPFSWVQLARWRRPTVVDLDATDAQLESMAPWYGGRPPKRGVRRLIAREQERLAWHGVSVFTPWSHWAAEGLRAEGIASERIRVIPPGVDLDAWRPAGKPRPTPSEPLRILFVGGDFERKGGGLLLEMMASELGQSFSLDVVTTAPVEPRKGVRVHRAGPNSPELRALFATADLFVLPAFAECFGIAAVEAMASGLPVIMSDVGGARDIVRPGCTGWLIEPTAGGLASALRAIAEAPDVLRSMGAAGRRVAEERFDGRRNDAAVIDLLLDLHERHLAANGRSG